MCIAPSSAAGAIKNQSVSKLCSALQLLSPLSAKLLDDISVLLNKGKDETYTESWIAKLVSIEIHRLIVCSYLHLINFFQNICLRHEGETKINCICVDMLTVGQVQSLIP